MDLFRRRFADRVADVKDWIDFRPDANFWFLFLLPPMFSLAWAYGGWIGLGVLIGFATMVTLVVATLFAFGLLAWIVANAVLDLIPPIRIALPRRRGISA